MNAEGVGPGGVNLAVSIASRAMAAANRSGHAPMRGKMRFREAKLVEWRCALPLSEVRRLHRPTAGRDG